MILPVVGVPMEGAKLKEFCK